MNDPSVHVTKLRPLLNQLREVLAPAQIKDFAFARKILAELRLRIALAEAEIDRLEKERQAA